MATFDDISPMRQGQTLPYAAWTFRTTKGDIEPMVAGTAYTLYIYDVATGTTTNGAGTFDTSAETGGLVVYHWDVNDTAVPGDKQVYIGYVPPSSGQGYTQPVEWTVLPVIQ